MGMRRLDQVVEARPGHVDLDRLLGNVPHQRLKSLEPGQIGRRTVATTSEAEAPVDSKVSPTRMARSMTARAVRWSTPSAPCHRLIASVGGPLSRTARPALSRKDFAADLPATREDRGGRGTGLIGGTGQL